MYVLIDNERMSLLYKHENYFTLSDVACLEGRDNYSMFDLYDAKGFRAYTNTELGILYRNITARDHTGLNRPQLLQVLFDICQRVPASDIDPIEADLQAAYAEKDASRCWRYVRGATRPSPSTEADLFNFDSLHAEPSEEEENNAKAGKLPALKAAKPPQAAGVGPARPAASTVAPARSASGPKRGTAKAIIWSVADKMWEESGKPTDKTEVLKLRKSIMDELETNQGIKRSSSSSELGVWHKTRAPF